MRVEERKIYRCGFCNKLYLSEFYCLQHEKRCHNNPENDRACFTCCYLGKKRTTIYLDDPGGGEYEGSVNVFYCRKLECYLIPPKAEHKGNAFDLGYYPNDPMPKVCEHQDNSEIRM